MKELYDHQLTEWLQLSGEYIARIRPDDERCAWIMFLLEQIKPFLSAAEYAQLLGEIKAAIDEQGAH